MCQVTSGHGAAGFASYGGAGCWGVSSIGAHLTACFASLISIAKIVIKQL